MAGETNVTVIGNLTADPELRFTTSGAAVASFTIASTPRVFDRQSNEWKDGDALFLRCSVWRDLAENCAETLLKGTRVIASGTLHQRTWQDRDGQNRISVELDVIDIGPSLFRATAKVTRTNRNAPPQQNNFETRGGYQAPQPAASPAPTQDDPWANRNQGASHEPPF